MEEPAALDVQRLSAIIESMLLVSSEALPVERVREIVLAEAPGTDPAAVDAAVVALGEAYADPARQAARGYRLDIVADGLQLRTPAENAPFLRRLLAARPPKLSKPAMETLAVIAYRQPVTKPEIESIRGVDVGAVLKALLERELIRIIGKSDDLGRPILYGTTKKFLELFGLRSLGALPTLREYHELDEVHQQQVDELEEREPRISDLAAKAAFLIERKHDVDLDALADAEVSLDEAAERAAAALAGDPPPGAGAGATGAVAADEDGATLRSTEALRDTDDPEGRRAIDAQVTDVASVREAESDDRPTDAPPPPDLDSLDSRPTDPPPPADKPRRGRARKSTPSEGAPPPTAPDDAASDAARARGAELSPPVSEDVATEDLPAAPDSVSPKPKTKLRRRRGATESSHE